MSIQQKGTEIFDSPSTVSSKQRFGSWCAVNKCTSWPCLDSSRAASTTSLSAPPDSQTPCCLLLETTFCHLGLSVPPTFLLVHTLKRQQLRDENPSSCIFYVSHRSGLTNEEQKMDRSMEFLRREINASLLQKESCEQQQQQQQKHRKSSPMPRSGWQKAIRSRFFLSSSLGLPIASAISFMSIENPSKKALRNQRRAMALEEANESF